jgi:hypothetical protein
MQGFLGQVKIAKEPDQGGEYPTRLRTIYFIDRLTRSIHRVFAHVPRLMGSKGVVEADD